MNKICPICGKEFDTEYSYQIYCGTECSKIADNKRSLKYYYDHLDSCRLKKREYYQKNKKKIIQYLKKYNQDHKEEISNYRKEYYQKNKERIIKHNKEYYAINNRRKQIESCSSKHNNCFNCPTENGECMYD